MTPLNPNTGFWRTDAGGAKVKAFEAGDFWRWGFSRVQENVYDPLNLGQWEFWVVARRMLEAFGIRNLSYYRLRTLAHAPVGFLGLAAELDRVYRMTRPAKRRSAA